MDGFGVYGESMIAPPIRLRTLLSAFLVTTVMVVPLTAQNLVINGDLENHTFSGCAYNQSNFSFTSGMVGATGYGAGDEIDVMVGACGSYGPAGPVGQTCIGLAANGAPPFDALTMELSAPLVVGQSYTLEFHGMSSIQSFSPAQGAVRIGLSTAAGTAGTSLWTSPLLAPGAFAVESHTFTASVAATELSIEVDPVSDCWLWLDGFSLVSAGPSLTWNGSCPGAGTADMASMTPGGLVYLGYSPLTGSWAVPSGPCAGTLVDIVAPTLAAVLTADAAGNASMPASVPAVACGAITIQAFDLASCTATNTVGL